MVETTAIPRKHPTCSFRQIDGQAVIANTETAEVHILNEVGSVIWSLIDGKRTLEGIVAEAGPRLAEGFDGIPADLRGDVSEFLEVIAGKGLIEMTGVEK